jgi:acyl-coenzyme A thioesterase PaaI-like protein
LTSEARVVSVAGSLPFEFSPHNCFACGSLNTHGIGLALHVEPSRSWADLILESRFEGWDGIAHGGILCTLLDEVMAWSLVGEDMWGVTARLAVDFRHPVPIGAPLHAEGWITRARRRVVETAGHIVDPVSGDTYATATGTYVAADEARKAELRARYGFRPDPATGPDPDAGPSATDTPVQVARS